MNPQHSHLLADDRHADRYEPSQSRPVARLSRPFKRALTSTVRRHPGARLR